jgi:nucleotide-binding universal stress UspA family protein
MSEFPEYMIRRILVALDASSQSIAALEEAAEMAAALKAELIGMFVEDINLLRGAQLPFARRVAFPSGAFEPIDTSRLEREMRAQAEQARRALAAAAESRKRPWSFRCVRGAVAAQLLEAAGTADVVMMGRAGWSPLRPASLGSTATVLASSAPGAILIVEQSPANLAPVQVVYDGSAQAGSVLRTAAGLALARGVGLVVFALAGTEADYQRMRARTLEIADHRFKLIQVQRLDAPSPALLAQAAQAHGGGLIILPGSCPLATGQAVSELLSRVPNPLLLIRSGQAEASVES